MRIDVDQLLVDRAAEARGEIAPSYIDAAYEVLDGGDLPPDAPTKQGKKRGPKPKYKPVDGAMDVDSGLGTKRKASGDGPQSAAKKARTSSKPKHQASGNISGLTFKLPATQEDEDYPCCLCPSTCRDGLLRVFEPPRGRKDIQDIERNLPKAQGGGARVWMAHEECAKVIPETWVDEVEDPNAGYLGKHPSGEASSSCESSFCAVLLAVLTTYAAAEMTMEKMVFGVDGVPKDRWGLVSFSLCTCIQPMLTIFRNVRCARRHGPRLTARLSNVPRASVPKLSMSLASKPIRCSVARTAKEGIRCTRSSRRPSKKLSSSIRTIVPHLSLIFQPGSTVFSSHLRNRTWI